MRRQNKYLVTSRRMKQYSERLIELTRFWRREETESGTCVAKPFPPAAFLQHSGVLWKRFQSTAKRPSKLLSKAMYVTYIRWSARKRIVSGERHSSMRLPILMACSSKLRLLTVRDSFACGSAMMDEASILKFSKRAAVPITGACKECVSALTGL